MTDHTHEVDDIIDVKKISTTLVPQDLPDHLAPDPNPETSLRPLEAVVKAPKELPKPKLDNTEVEQAVRALNSGEPLQGDEGQED